MSSSGPVALGSGALLPGDTVLRSWARLALGCSLGSPLVVSSSGPIALGSGAVLPGDMVLRPWARLASGCALGSPIGVSSRGPVALGSGTVLPVDTVLLPWARLAPGCSLGSPRMVLPTDLLLAFLAVSASISAVSFFILRTILCTSTSSTG